MATGFQIYWKKRFLQKGVSSHPDCYPNQIIEVQEGKKESSSCLETELDKMNTQIQNLKHDIIATLRNDIAKIEDQQHQEIKRRIEDFVKKQKKFS